MTGAPSGPIVLRRSRNEAPSRDEITPAWKGTGSITITECNLSSLSTVLRNYGRVIFPSSQRRARSASPIGRSLKKGCAVKRMPRSHRSGAAGVARQLLLSCRATRPLRRGECAPPIRHRNYDALSAVTDRHYSARTLSRVRPSGLASGDAAEDGDSGKTVKRKSAGSFSCCIQSRNDLPVSVDDLALGVYF